MKKIEKAWQGFAAMVVPATASETQRAEMRKAFFAGASVVFTVLVNGVSTGDDITEDDMNLAKDLDDELSEFGAQLDKEVLEAKARDSGFQA